jgi:ATP-binding cassette subfamily B (MDR/TAP) protein 1
MDLGSADGPRVAAEEIAEEITEEKTPQPAASQPKDGTNKATEAEKKELDVQSSASSSEAGAMRKLDSKIDIRQVKEGEEAWAHLPEHERDIIRKQLQVPEVSVSYKSLYRYATRIDLIIVAISLVCAVIGGAAAPLMTVFPPSAFWITHRY